LNGRTGLAIAAKTEHSRRIGGAQSAHAWDSAAMMKREAMPIASIYVPVKRRATLNSATVDEIAESMMKDGQKTPILVRRDGERFILVEGLHRLEACKKLGETTIFCYLVDARKH
jgi:sulfiredoxin